MRFSKPFSYHLHALRPALCALRYELRALRYAPCTMLCALLSALRATSYEPCSLRYAPCALPLAPCAITPELSAFSFALSYQLSAQLPPRSNKHHFSRLQQYLKVQPQRPVVNIGKVHLNPVFKADLVSPGSALPEACYAGLHGKSPSLPDLILLHLSRYGWSGTNKTHLTFEDVDQLRQLI